MELRREYTQARRNARIAEYVATDHPLGPKGDITGIVLSYLLSGSDALIVLRLVPGNKHLQKLCSGIKLRRAAEHVAASGWSEGLLTLSGVRNLDHNRILVLAAANGHVDAMQFAIEKGATRVNSAFIRASEEGHIPAMEFLISIRRNLDFGVAMCKASPSRLIEIMQLLADNCPPGDKTIWGAALCRAAVLGHMDAIRLASERVAGDAGFINTGLVWAAAYGHIEAMKFFFENGATNVDQALEWAARHGRVGSMPELLAHGATNINECLFIAISEGPVQVVQFLIDNGATNLEQVLHLVDEESQPEIARILRAAIASKSQ